jgi:two-component system sensor histidine kinase RegB
MPDLREDAELIGQQADRCRDILHSMGQAGKDDLHMRSAPLSAVLREAAAPHSDRGKTVLFDTIAHAGSDAMMPNVLRKPEIIHGLRNLIQNAVDFSIERVWVDSSWTRDHISVRISDDGDGFPLHLIGRIGDPFMRHRRDDDRARRTEYVGMGLGLFIAKTLLERTGAKLRFFNGSDPFLSDDERPLRCGAIVEVIWPREFIEARDSGPLGENRIIDT